MNILDLTTQLGLWAQQHPKTLLYGGGSVMALTMASSLLQRTRRPKQTTQGSARWATPEEIRQAGLTAAHGVVVGRLGNQLLCDDSETPVGIWAPNRSGKGIGPILCTLLGGWLQSVLVYDPAGGANAVASAGWRAWLGHRVELFTPRRSPQTCINVEDLIRVRQPEEFDDAWAISESLLAPSRVAQDSATAQHFRRQATILLTAAQLHMLYTSAKASLGQLWTLLTQQYASLQACIKAMIRTVHTPHGRHPVIVQLATELANVSSDKELSGIWSTALGPLLPYADWLTQRSTDTSTIDLNDLQYGQVPMSLYLVAPNTTDLDRLAPIYRVISEMAVRRLQQHPERSAFHRLLVIADEAASYGYSKVLNRGAAETAKYGIKLFVVFQDIPQTEGTFGRDNNIWGNTQTKIFFAPNSDLTAKRISENFLGQETVEQPVLSRQQRFGSPPSVAYQQVGRFQMTVDELMAMQRRAALVVCEGLRPILCGKTNVLVDPEYQGRYAALAP